MAKHDIVVEAPLTMIRAMRELDVVFHNAYEMLMSTNIQIKPWWYPFSSSSTTTSSNQIWLARTFKDWKPVEREENLIHEARHLIQHSANSRFDFSTNYLIDPQFRWRAEVEAEKDGIRYLYKVYNTHFDNITLSNMSVRLVEDHFLPKKYVLATMQEFSEFVSSLKKNKI